MVAPQPLSLNLVENSSARQVLFVVSPQTTVVLLAIILVNFSYTGVTRQKCAFTLFSFAGYLDVDGSFTRAVELTDVNSLPGAENHLSAIEDYRFAASDNRAFYVRV
jgi:hypothetical protein